MGAKTFKEATAKRQQRCVEQVAPLMVQGLGVREIGRRLGLSSAQATHDVQLVRDLWKGQYSDARDEWAPRILATYEWMLAECAGAWEQSKQGRTTRIINPDGTELIRQEPPDPRWLSGMLAVAKEASTFLGIREGVDAVARVEVADATRQALAPMSTDAYLAMLASTGGLPGINAVPPVARREADDEAIEVQVVDQPADGDVAPVPKRGRFLRRD